MFTSSKTLACSILNERLVIMIKLMAKRLQMVNLRQLRSYFDRLNNESKEQASIIFQLIIGLSLLSSKISEEIVKTENKDLNFFSLFILEFSNDMPFFYGLFSIMFAVLLGISVAFIRRFFSNLKKKILIKS